VTGYRH
jgi:hypothetical protein